jgi:DegV family protein with EDD domain
MSVRIIIDSTADTTAAVKTKCAIVPLTVRFGNTEYIDGVTINHREFYEKLVESDELPTTSQATPDAFAQAYQKTVDAGQKAVVLTVASQLSGTYQSATIAAMDFPGSVYVVDSKTVAIGTGILAQLAVEMAEAGADAETIARRLSAERENVRLVALLDTLEYLKKGGRVTSATALAGTLLGIKPVIAVENGEVAIPGKARGSKNGSNMLRELADKSGICFDLPFALAYSGLDDTMLRKYIADSSSLYEGNTTHLPVYTIGSTIGTHAGPGAIAVAFFAKN